MSHDNEEQAAAMTTDVPALIAAAGDPAVRAYHEFLDDPRFTAATRRTYRTNLHRFILWCEGHGQALAGITASEVAAYTGSL